MAGTAVFYDSGVSSSMICAYYLRFTYPAATFYNTNGLDETAIDGVITGITDDTLTNVFVAVTAVAATPATGEMTDAQVTTLADKLDGEPGSMTAAEQFQDDSTGQPNSRENRVLNCFNYLWVSGPNVPDTGIIGNQYPPIVKIMGRLNYYTTLHRSTASSGAVGTITDTGCAYVVDSLIDKYVAIVSGTGAGQIRKILSNTATVITPTENFSTAPDNTSVYEIRGYTKSTAYEAGTLAVPLAATAGGAATITRAGSGWTTNQFRGMSVRIIAGTGLGQESLIVSNTGTALTVVENWAVAPDNTSTFVIVSYQFYNNEYTDLFDEPLSATAGGANTITDSTQAFITNLYSTGFNVVLLSGTGQGQQRDIASNTATVLTTVNNWATNPDTTTTFNIRRQETSYPYILADYYINYYILNYLTGFTAPEVTDANRLLGLYTDEGRVNLNNVQDIAYIQEKLDLGKAIFTAVN